MNVSKGFGSRQVLKDISFSLEAGQIVSLIGGNGSGKTTTFRLILGFLDPDTGSILLDGRSLENGDVCYLSEQRSLYQDCTVYEQLRLTARLNGIRDFQAGIDRWLDELKMTPLKGELIGRLSKGNQQKTALINCLIGEGSLVIMDEPFTALDRDNIRLFIKTIERLKQEGRTVLVSSHIYQPVNDICDRFLLLKDGRIGADLSRQQLREEERRLIEVPLDYEPETEMPLDCQREGEGSVCYVFDEKEKAKAFAAAAVAEDADVTYRHCRIEDWQ